MAARAAKRLVVAAALALGGTAAMAGTTIAALGDSLTQGYGLPQAEGLVPQLEAWLRERGHDVTVINAGVSGDTTAGGLSRVDWTLTPDVDAMIVALGGNDLLRGLDPAVSRANLDGILTAADEKGVEVLLVGLSAPGNYGPDYKAEFDAIYADLSDKWNTLLEPSFMAALEEAAGGDFGEGAARFMQPDGIHPNATGVALIVEALGPRVEELIAQVD